MADNNDSEFDSDAEVERWLATHPSSPGPWPNAGKASIEKIRANAERDRIETKRYVSSLKP
ncbi:hypothetical protein TWF694_007826 [Orbilia ellipsospora]|uniref:Uncharacterized protein n=1 Tax=Orbilia ellipsospora TaxID=2528407 RepID=A0AAV9XLG8_9PEZI